MIPKTLALLFFLLIAPVTHVSVHEYLHCASYWVAGSEENCDVIFDRPTDGSFSGHALQLENPWYNSHYIIEPIAYMAALLPILMLSYYLIADVKRRVK